MNKNLKAGILLVILGIPAFVFIFLHGFGENRFEIPLYYETGVDTAFAECNWQVPHKVDLKELKGRISVVSFSIEQINTLNRLNVDYEKHSVFQTIIFHPKIEYILNNEPEWKGGKEVLFIPTTNFSGIISCFFIIDKKGLEKYPLVLVDTNQQIRGYYYISDEDEIERLIHELNILLENLK